MDNKRVPGAKILNELKGLKCDCFTNFSGRWTCKECLVEERTQFKNVMADFATKQEPLGSEFREAIFENIEELYVAEDNNKEVGE